MANKKIKTLSQLKKEMELLKYKTPRAGVHPTKVVPDKTKYTRKKKHKDKNGQS